MKLIYGSLHKMGSDRRKALREQAIRFLDQLGYGPAYGQGNHLAGYGRSKVRH